MSRLLFEASDKRPPVRRGGTNVLLKRPQWQVFLCKARFRVLVAGRRFGKTFLSIVELIQAASKPGQKVWYVGPTIKQAKATIWKALKAMTKPYWAKKPNETDLTIELIWGGTISVRGADHYDALRGDGLDFIVLDEYASMHPEAWTEVLRPALADKQGSALFIGTPRGHNHFFNLYEWAEDQSDWQRFQFTAEQGGNVTVEELESATHEMDERTFRQEFLATFENLGVGRAYYAFDRAHHVRALHYNPNLPLVWSLDFNMNPLCSVIGQVVNGIVCILDESILPDSNTLAACEQFLERTRQWVTCPTLPEPPPEYAQAYELLLQQQIPPPPLNVYVYGDATGVQRRTSASRTDWQIVKDLFGRYGDRYRACFRVSSANPPVKDRINCVNAMLLNHAGDRRVLIDPKCKDLIKDLEQVSWKADPYGNSLADLDKSDPLRSHVSDSLGYWLARDFPMRAQRGEQAGPRII